MLSITCPPPGFTGTETTPIGDSVTVQDNATPPTRSNLPPWESDNGVAVYLPGASLAARHRRHLPMHPLQAAERRARGGARLSRVA